VNIYSFTGRIGKDSETRFAPSGMAICSFSVAVDYGFGENKGTNWLRCSLFGKRAEGKLQQYLIKGAQVAISGELRIREYDDKEGNKRTSVEVSVDKLDLIGGRNEQQGNNAPQSQNQSMPAQGGQPYQQGTDPFADNGQPQDGIPF
jgi:single-strand DNA-binding protein